MTSSPTSASSIRSSTSSGHYLEIVKLLVERGAEVDMETDEDTTPSGAIAEDVARINGQYDVEAYLREVREKGTAGSES